MLGRNTCQKIVHLIRSPLRIGLLVLATSLLAESTLFASGSRARSIQSRAPSGWTGIDLRPSEATAVENDNEAERVQPEVYATDPAESDQPKPQPVPNTKAPEATESAALEPQPESKPEPSVSAPEPWFQLPPRERRSRSYNSLKAPPPTVSPSQQPVAQPSHVLRNRTLTADRPRKAPSISEFQQVLAGIKAEKEAEEAEARERDEQDSEDGARPRSRSDRIASSSNGLPVDEPGSLQDRLLFETLADGSTRLASQRSLVHSDQLFMDEPLSNVRLNEILYYLESGDSAQVIRIAPGAQNNSYFNPPVSSEFQRSRAVYEQVFRSNVQTR